MLTFIDQHQQEYGAQVVYKTTNAVNGERSVSGTIYTNQQVLTGIDRGWRFRLNDEYYVVTYAKPRDSGRKIYVEFDAVHQFFWDFFKSSVHKALSDGSHRWEEYLHFIFDGSGYTFNNEVTVKAFRKESFGYKNRLSLFNDIIKQAGVEFVVHGRVVRILERAGSDLSTVVRKNFNMDELKIEKNIHGFFTYQKGFGAWKDENNHSKGRLEVEYKSPLAVEYGVIEGDPVVDERYTRANELTERLKKNVENSYAISVQLDMEDLTQAGYQYEQPHAGDYIMAINETLQFRERIRIVSYTSEYDIRGRLVSHKVTCNDIGSVKREISQNSSLSAKIDQAQADSVEALKQASQAIVSADGKNTVYTGSTFPTDDPQGTLIRGDLLWYKNGEKTELYIWNGAEWELQTLDIDKDFQKSYAAKVAEIDKALTENETKINNLKVGGKNLVPVSLINKSLNVQTTEEYSLSNWAGEFLGSEAVQQIFVEGKQYTIRYEAELIERTTVPTLFQKTVGFILYSPTSGTKNIPMYFNDLTDKGDKRVFQLTFTAPKILSNHRLLFYTNRYTTDGVAPVGYDKVRFTNFKIESGTISTDWTPAPGDEEAKLAAISTKVSQLSGSWAVKNLTSAGTVLNQINLLANGTNRIDGLLTHITGQTLIDDATIKSAAIESLDAGKIITGTLDASRAKIINIDASSVTSGIFRGLVFKGGRVEALNDAMVIDLNDASMILSKDANINFTSENNTLRRSVADYGNQFIKFETGNFTRNGITGYKANKTIIGSNRGGTESSEDGLFTGIRIWNMTPPSGKSAFDQIDFIGDLITFQDKASGAGRSPWIMQTYNANGDLAFYPENSGGKHHILGMENRKFKAIYTDEVWVNGVRLKEMLRDLANKMGYTGVNNWTSKIS